MNTIEKMQIQDAQLKDFIKMHAQLLMRLDDCGDSLFQLFRINLRRQAELHGDVIKG